MQLESYKIEIVRSNQEISLFYTVKIAQISHIFSFLSNVYGIQDSQKSIFLISYNI